jgi:hypothetical protein
MEENVSTNYFTRDFATEMRRRSRMPANNNGHSKMSMSAEDIDVCMKYCRWLHHKRFLEDLNKANARFGLPPHNIPVLIKKDRGKQLYDALLREITKETGSVPLVGEGQRKAIVDALVRKRAQVTR